jgi:uncharacterized protein (TIGR02646 family)
VHRGRARRAYRRYRDARRDLLDQLGPYCSYCERVVADPHVEHVLPRATHPEAECEWGNLLLACTSCNSHKRIGFSGNLADYYWPDRHNTWSKLRYREDGLVGPGPGLRPDQQRRACRTVDLTKLNREPQDDPAARDRRWELRLQAWVYACGAAKELQSSEECGRCPKPALRHWIVELARACGFFSVWVTVFRGDADMVSRLIEAFPGTRRSCFPPRAGGSVSGRVVRCDG